MIKFDPQIPIRFGVLIWSLLFKFENKEDAAFIIIKNSDYVFKKCDILDKKSLERLETEQLLYSKTSFRKIIANYFCTLAVEFLLRARLRRMVFIFELNARTCESRFFISYISTLNEVSTSV